MECAWEMGRGGGERLRRCNSRTALCERWGVCVCGGGGGRGTKSMSKKDEMMEGEHFKDGNKGTWE
jgi:hypothetical protein